MKKLLLFLLFTQAATAAELQEVVVTAQRKAQNIQDVPVSVSVLTAEDLDSRQVDVVKQLLTNSPNLLGNNNLATSTALSVFIRGVGTTENLATAETSVGVYVDGVYIARQGFNNLGLSDVESVEILRGPQGVLYGRNTNGGAVKINLMKPQQDDTLSYSVSYGEANYMSADVIANKAINDSTSLRVNFGAYEYDGFVFAKNLNKDVNGSDSYGGRLALRHTNDLVDINVSADYYKVNTDGNYQTDIAGVLNPKPTSLFTTLSTFPAFNTNETSGVSINVLFGDVDSLEVQSITGYRKLDQQLSSDVSGQPVSLYNFLQDQMSEQVSQEFQFVGKLTNNINFVGGVYYFNEQADVSLRDDLKTTPTAAVLTLSKVFDVEVTNYAAYAQLEYQWNNLTLTAGARYTTEDRSLNIVQTSNSTVPVFSFNNAGLNARGVVTDKSYSDTTPRVSVSYEISDNATAYASYTEGFRAGGWTGRALRVDQYVNFNPEYVKTKEVGLKLNGSNWRWNTTLFVTDYEDLFNTLTVNGAFAVQTADAEIRGLESEGSILVNDWLSVYGSVGKLDAKYVGTRPANLASELQRAPDLQAKVGLKAEVNNLVWNVGAYRVSEYRLTPANLAVTAPSLANRGIDVTGPHTIIDSSLTYTLNNSSLTLACVNCADKTFVEGAAYIGQYAGAWMGDSRWFSLTFSQKF